MVTVEKAISAPILTLLAMSRHNGELILRLEYYRYSNLAAISFQAKLPLIFKADVSRNQGGLPELWRELKRLHREFGRNSKSAGRPYPYTCQMDRYMECSQTQLLKIRHYIRSE
ncbi:hypothetical protein [Paenibacillus xanthanilyticus]|uniref:Uncharacterized protein n=1 Tax=Paenibacillus xanthanilyticus TaxID=1783531 RepID=A0ABV8K3U3_9BACL